MKTVRGFSLIEMATSLATASAMLTVGVPSMQDYIVASHRSEASTSLYSALQKARMEAVAHNRVVTICIRSTDTASTCDLSPTAKWHSGWMVYTSPNSTRPGKTETEAKVLSTQDAFANDLAISGNFGSTSLLQFDAYGRANQSVSFTICDPQNRIQGRKVVVSPTGRVSLQEFDGCGQTT